jgi:hypothetical protein
LNQSELSHELSQEKFTAPLQANVEGCNLVELIWLEGFHTVYDDGLKLGKKFCVRYQVQLSKSIHSIENVPRL